jgi:phage recombination protein Bet
VEPSAGSPCRWQRTAPTLDTGSGTGYSTGAGDEPAPDERTPPLTLEPAADAAVSPAPTRGVGFTREQVELVKRTIALGATDDELTLFLNVCQRTGLDPFARQAFAIKRWNQDLGRDVMSFQTSIDGYRLIADRACRERGWVRTEPPGGGTEWAELHGKTDVRWVDAWLHADTPLAARYTVHIVTPRQTTEFSAVARFDSYAQRKRDGTLTRMWAAMPDLMIAKCAEALALRKAFPQELSGIYTTDEMAQAWSGEPEQDAPYGVPIDRRWKLAHAKKRLVDLVLFHAEARGLTLDKPAATTIAGGLWERLEPEERTDDAVLTEGRLIALVDAQESIDIVITGPVDIPAGTHVTVPDGVTVTITAGDDIVLPAGPVAEVPYAETPGAAVDAEHKAALDAVAAPYEDPDLCEHGLLYCATCHAEDEGEA